MKSLRKGLVLLFLVVSLSLYISAESGAQEKPIVLRYAEATVEADPISQAGKRFSEIVAEKSGGRIVIELYYGGQLGSNQEMVQGAQMGAIDLIRVKPPHLADAGLSFMNVFALPYMFNDSAHVDRVMRSSVGKEVFDRIEKEDIGLVGIGYYPISPRSFFFTKKVVKSIADMKGLKLRVMAGELYIDLVESFGASPTPMAFSELYAALKTGVVDGGEQPVKGYYAQKFYEVCPYFTFDNHQADPAIVLMSKIKWEKLSEADQGLLREAMLEATDYFVDMMKGLNEQYIEELKGKGVQFFEVDNPQEWQDAVVPLYEKYGKDYMDLIDKIKANQ